MSPRIRNCGSVMSGNERSRMRDTIASVRTESAGSSARRLPRRSEPISLGYRIKWAARPPASVVLGRAEHPDERLDVDEIPGAPVGEVGAQDAREAQQAAIGAPTRGRPVVELVP